MTNGRLVLAFVLLAGAAAAALFAITQLRTLL